jgi:hypothetical protein
MARSSVTTSAVPRAALAPDNRVLAFEPLGWSHLAAYLDKAGSLPLAGAGSPGDNALTDAAAALREAVRGFGTPAQLAGQPGVLDGVNRPRPACLAFLWTIARLQAAASEAIGALQSCVAPAAPADTRRAALRSLGAISAVARDQAAALLPELQQFRSVILAVNRQFSAAAAGTGRALQEEWEAVGARRASIETLQARLQGTGLLHPHRRHELQTQIASAEQELMAATARAEELRLQAAVLQEVVHEGAWLDASLGGIIDFLQALRAAWSGFGGAMSQLGADASPAQLADNTWLAAQLDVADAAPRWQLLASAAERFRSQLQAPTSTVTPTRVTP